MKPLRALLRGGLFIGGNMGIEELKKSMLNVAQGKEENVLDMYMNQINMRMAEINYSEKKKGASVDQREILRRAILSVLEEWEGMSGQKK